MLRSYAIVLIFGEGRGAWQFRRYPQRRWKQVFLLNGDCLTELISVVQRPHRRHAKSSLNKVIPLPSGSCRGIIVQRSLLEAHSVPVHRGRGISTLHIEIGHPLDPSQDPSFDPEPFLD